MIVMYSAAYHRHTESINLIELIPAGQRDNLKPSALALPTYIYRIKIPYPYLTYAY